MARWAATVLRGIGMALRAIVIGTGWAAEGHAQALCAAGVAVAAICGRSQDRAEALAARLGISLVRLNWRSALSELKPDIVAIATPGAAHREMAEAAAQEGCHVFSEKPMGVDAADARAMLAAVRRAGVKHAYGATGCLEPVFLQARQLIADGTVGTLIGVDVQTHMGQSPLLPFSWFHELGQGGGMLNQIFTHVLAQVLYVTQGRPSEVAGEARCRVARAPVGPEIHDFRQWFTPVARVDDQTDWREADADTEYSVLMRISPPTGDAITARIYGSLNSHDPQGGQFLLHGTSGTLAIKGSGNGKEIHIQQSEGRDWHPVAPAALVPGWVASASNEQNNWNTAFRNFVADVRGEEHSFYPTFEDGCQASEIIDIIRAGAGWTQIQPRSS